MPYSFFKRRGHLLVVADRFIKLPLPDQDPQEKVIDLIVKRFHFQQRPIKAPSPVPPTRSVPDPPPYSQPCSVFSATAGRVPPESKNRPDPPETFRAPTGSAFDVFVICPAARFYPARRYPNQSPPTDGWIAPCGSSDPVSLLTTRRLERFAQTEDRNFSAFSGIAAVRPEKPRSGRAS